MTPGSFVVKGTNSTTKKSQSQAFTIVQPSGLKVLEVVKKIETMVVYNDYAVPLLNRTPLPQNELSMGICAGFHVTTAVTPEDVSFHKIEFQEKTDPNKVTGDGPFPANIEHARRQPFKTPKGGVGERFSDFPLQARKKLDFLYEKAGQKEYPCDFYYYIDSSDNEGVLFHREIQKIEYDGTKMTISKFGVTAESKD